MKKSKKLARNYAQALFEENKGNLQLSENILNAIKEINSSIFQVKNASLILESPAVPKEEKKELIKKILKENSDVSNILTHFLFLLIDNQRINMLPEIQNELSNLIDKSKGIVHAEISSAYELKDDTIENLRRKLEKTLISAGEKLKITKTIEPELIGGLKVKIKDLIYDGSIRARLDGLKRRLG